MRSFLRATLPAVGVILAACKDAGGGTTPEPTPAHVVIAEDSAMLIVGQQMKLSGRVLDAAGQVIPGAVIQWSSSHPAVAGTNAAGEVSGRTYGEARVTARLGGLSDSALVRVVYPGKDSVAISSTGDSTRVRAGNGAELVVPPGVFALGSGLLLQPGPAEAVNTGESLGIGARVMFYVAGSSLSAQLGEAVEDDLQSQNMRLTLLLPLSPGQNVLPKEEVWASIRDVGTGDRSLLRADEAIEVVGELGTRVLRMTFLLPVLSGAGNAPSGITDLRVSAMKASNVCGSSSWRLYPQGQSPEADDQPVPDPDRIPLILIHGWSMEALTCRAADENNPASSPWGAWLAAIDTSRFEVWLYRYPSFYSVTHNARILRELILAHDLDGRELVMMGHSMGGLVGATYMVNFPQEEQVRALITLGTPFQGSPLASVVEENAWSSLCAAGGTLLAPFRFRDALSTAGAADLRTDAALRQRLAVNASAVSNRITSFSSGKDAWRFSDRDEHGSIWVSGCLVGSRGPEHRPNDAVVSRASALALASPDKQHFIPELDHFQVANHALVRNGVLPILERIENEIPTNAKRVEIYSGNGQSGQPGSELSSPLIVRVTDAGGVGVPGVRVTFAVESGGGSMAPTDVDTDVQGLARTKWRLGPAEAIQIARASADGLEGSPVLFQADAREVHLEYRAAIVTATDHTCAVTGQGVAYCWGSDGRGNLGNGERESTTTPHPVSGGLAFARITAGGDPAALGHMAASCGLTPSGAAFCWGANDYGALGSRAECNSGDQSACSPAPVSGNRMFVQIVTSGLHTCAIDQHGVAYCWGYNGFGAVGAGTQSDLAYFAPAAIASGERFRDINVSREQTCALTLDGRAYCWGAGVGPTTPGCRTGVPCSTYPQAVHTNRRWARIHVGWQTCGLDAQGAAHCWVGSDPAPVPVSNTLRFVDMDAGGGHSCGITAAGAAYCWGSNTAGQLGNGTTISSTTPVLVSGGLTFASIATGGIYTCGVTRSGAMYCWGWNGRGNLGNGTTSESHTPVLIQQTSLRKGRSRP
jgi:pimeloyl-ACP methyl ester carboxylesterase